MSNFSGFFPISSIFRQNRQVLLDFANIANFEAQNRGNSAIGDTSPAQIFHRQRVAQNRGFGEKSPEMLTLLTAELPEVTIYNGHLASDKLSSGGHKSNLKQPTPIDESS